tara:strand:- start:60 stop:329 length:270 start_codon:yes stop_codon:yes gene_type:complete
MSMHQATMKLTPQQANVIPAGKYIYTDETFLVKQPIASVEAFARQGKPLVPAYFSFQHGGQEFTPVYQPAPSMTYNYGTYIYNIVDGFQ